MKITLAAFLCLGQVAVLQSCREKVQIPVVNTFNTSGISTTKAISGGTVIDDGGDEIIVRGVCWDIHRMPTTASNKTIDGAGGGSFTSLISGLADNTTYYVRAYAENQEGTGYGDEVSFTTHEVSLANLSTNIVYFISSSTAVISGTILDNGGGSISSYGVCWNTDPLPTESDNKTSGKLLTGNFISNIGGLTANTMYYVRAYAVSNAGTSYGNELSFITLERDGPVFKSELTYETVEDIDGNEYKTTQLGTQVWFAENLKTTRYRDGKPIPRVTATDDWSSLTSEAYCWYDNDVSGYVKSNYGALYNWYAANNSMLCPEGWHLPTNTEWTELINFNGGASVAGIRLKENGTTHWSSGIEEATNESGFTALPGGSRSYGNDWDYGLGEWSEMGYYGYWWSLGSDSHSSYSAVVMSSLSGSVSVILKPHNTTGFSVRCLKD